MQKTGLIELTDRELDLVAAAGNYCQPQPEPCEQPPAKDDCNSCGGDSYSNNGNNSGNFIGVSLLNGVSIL